MVFQQLAFDGEKDRSGLCGAVGLFGRLLRFGTLTVRGPDGWSQTFRGPCPGPSAELQINSRRVVTRTLAGGALGFAEAYVDGDCDSLDLVSFLQMAALNQDQWQSQLNGRPWYRAAARAFHVLRRNTRSGARRNIAEHYDLGNAFYAAWLDRTMTYSSAVFTQREQNLRSAQRHKHRLIAAAADLQPKDHVLEIGCGWGGFAVHAASEIGCRVTAITISDAQYQYVRDRVARENLADKITVELLDYRDLRGVFDKIVSIEMIEAVGEPYWPQFFNTLHDHLKPSGRAVLQAITIDDAIWERYRKDTDFIQRYIFPGGMLPCLTVMRDRSAAAGLQWRGARAFGKDYARTLAEWRTRFERAWPEIARMGFDEHFRRLWRYYLSYCEAGFRVGRIDVHQVVLEKA